MTSLVQQERLFDAIRHGSLAEVRALLNEGIDPNLGRKGQRTPLGDACVWASADVVSALIKHGADTNLIDGDDESPLWIAVWNDQPAIAELLIKQGADISFCCPHSAISMLQMSRKVSPSCEAILDEALARQQAAMQAHTLDLETPGSPSKPARRI